MIKAHFLRLNKIKDIIKVGAALNLRIQLRQRRPRMRNLPGFIQFKIERKDSIKLFELQLKRIYMAPKI